MTLSAACRVSARTTPIPCVPSTSLTTSGAPLVIKLVEGTQGIGVVLAETRQAAESVIDAFRGLNAHILVQEYIEEAIAGVVRGVSDAGDRKIDTLAGEQLQRAQLIPGTGNGDRFVERIAAQHFKLAQRGGTVKGNRRANARDHRIKMGKLTPFIMDR